MSLDAPIHSVRSIEPKLQIFEKLPAFYKSYQLIELKLPAFWVKLPTNADPNLGLTSHSLFGDEALLTNLA